MHRTSATIKIVCHGLYYILSGTDPESHPQASQVSTSLKIPEHTQHRETKHQKKARRDLLLPAAYPQGSAAHKPLSFRPPPQQDHPCSRRPSRTKTVVNLANTYRLALAPQTRSGCRRSLETTVGSAARRPPSGPQGVVGAGTDGVGEEAAAAAACF